MPFIRLNINRCPQKMNLSLLKSFFIFNEESFYSISLICYYDCFIQFFCWIFEHFSLKARCSAPAYKIDSWCWSRQIFTVGRTEKEEGGEAPARSPRI